MLPFKSKALYTGTDSSISGYRLKDHPFVIMRKPTGLNPRIWGPNVWYVIHLMAANYVPSKESAMAFRSFISSLSSLLPCDMCKIHLGENLRKVPLTSEVLRTNEALLKWTYDFHNAVNIMLKKVSPPYDVIRAYYLNPPCSTCVAGSS